MVAVTDTSASAAHEDDHVAQAEPPAAPALVAKPPPGLQDMAKDHVAKVTLAELTAAERAISSKVGGLMALAHTTKRPGSQLPGDVKFSELMSAIELTDVAVLQAGLDEPLSLVAHLTEAVQDEPLRARLREGRLLHLLEVIATHVAPRVRPALNKHALSDKKALLLLLRDVPGALSEDPDSYVARMIESTAPPQPSTPSALASTMSGLS